jgi:hypothetical protein
MSVYKELQERYKVLFEHKLDSKEPFALFGFECGEGWYNIIKNACHTICMLYDWECNRLEMLRKSSNNIAGIVERRKAFDPDITEDKVKTEIEESIQNTLIQIQIHKSKLPRIIQIKEKLGTLRIYLDNSISEFRHVMHYAELMSAVTCEKCGNAGKTYRIGWHQTLCREHAIERYGEQSVNDYELDKREAAKLITQLSEKQKDPI